MAIYAIGDVHGCLPELRALLAAIAFHPGRDRLWFVGDLINRGPDSLGTIRFVRGLGEGAVVVMGNHEGRAVAKLSGQEDRGLLPFYQEMQSAPDALALGTWLRALPLLHYDRTLGISMVHAGLSPAWSLSRACGYSAALGRIFRDRSASQTFFQGWNNAVLDEEPPRTERLDHLRFAFAVMTRLRLCAPDGRPLWPTHPLVSRLANPHAFVPSPETQSPDFSFRPWFEQRPATEKGHIVYGHWAAAGLTLNLCTKGLDSGCVYGGRLTAMRLDHPDHPITQVDCPQYVVPESFSA